MAGEITVSNPNLFQDVTTDVTDVPSVGGDAACTVSDGHGVLVPPAHEYAGELVPGTNSRTYTCTFDHRPDYTGGTNTATVTWDGGSADSGAVPVAFELATETDSTVTVTDDKVSLETPELLGTATWNAEGTPTTFAYDLGLAGVENTCTDYTNTATLHGDVPGAGADGLTAQATVTVCGNDIAPAEVDVNTPNRVSGVETAVLAATGAPAGLGLWSTVGAVLLVLGGWLMIRSRRRDATGRR